MTIKKVVLQGSKKVEKKVYPKFDKTKLYIYKNINKNKYKLKDIDNNLYQAINLETNLCEDCFTFNYAIDNKHLCCFNNIVEASVFLCTDYFDCTEFMVKPTITTTYECADNEVLLEDCKRGKKIYAGIYRDHAAPKKLIIITSDDSAWNTFFIENTCTSALSYSNKNHTIFQFDTFKEFIQWAAEQLGIRETVSTPTLPINEEALEQLISRSLAEKNGCANLPIRCRCSGITCYSAECREAIKQAIMSPPICT